MSRADVTLIIAFTVFIPFAGCLLLAAAGGTRRMRKALALLYAAVSAGFNLALLSGYLQHPARAAWGSLRFTSLSFPAFFMLNMLAAGAVLFACFRRAGVSKPSVLAASIAAACGFAGLALVVSSSVPQMFLALGASAAAVAGLLAHGGTGVTMRLRAFIPWLLSDALFVIGVILSFVFLKETSVLVRPPLTSGSEVQVILVLSIFLASALLRLGVFPVQGWIAGLVGRTDPSWNSFFLGSLNFLLAGMRLVVTVTLLARLVATDWGMGLGIAAVCSVVAGPVIAVRSRDTQSTVAGLYCMLSGMLLLSLSLYSRAGTEASLFLLLTAPLSLTAFLMGSGTAASLRGSRLLGVERLGARAAPAAFVVTLLSGLAVAGIPIMDGFIARAYLVLAGFDKADVTRFFGFGAVLAMAATALALVAVCRFAGGTFSGKKPAASELRPDLIEGLVPLAMCAFSVLLGLFPALLLRNFITGASKLLYAPGFQGPAVVFRGTGDATASALRTYGSWASVAAAFLLVVAGLVLVSYFASRAAFPSGGQAARRLPWVGGGQGEYAGSWSEPPEKGLFALREALRRVRSGWTGRSP